MTFSFRFRAMGIFAALIFMILIISLASPHFLTSENVLSVIRNFSFVAIMAIGEMLVILTAGIDLSVGSILGLTTCLTAIGMRLGWPPVVASGLGILAGILIGFTNGILITSLNLPPFIVTLGTLSIARGLAYVITDGWPVAGFSTQFMALGQGTLLWIPIPIWVMVGLAGFGSAFLNLTRWGRWLYAVGGNETATHLSGVPVKRVKIMAYMISGFTAAAAGILLMARLGVAQPTGGLSYELDVIAAAVIGGASLNGGAGTITGLLIGAAIMGVLRNGLVLMSVSAFWQQVVIGVIIVLAVTLDRLRR
ncbi:ABC transporter permease [candidate division KSB1 bacterium]|nr:ABC transporter permease [candidate division KSB1 bacterium]